MIDTLHNLLQHRVVARRIPDFIVGSVDDPYLLRWYLIPRNPVFNIYLHNFKRSDDDRAHHDHPWWSLSLLLHDWLIEHTISRGGVHRRRLISPGTIRLRSARFAHRIETIPCSDAWTLFITGPKLRTWGFHCPNGWVPWQRFTAAGNPGEIGKGCGV